jgi:hypothetical protein
MDASPPDKLFAALSLSRFCVDKIVQFEHLEQFYSETPEVRKLIQCYGLSKFVDLFPAVLQKKEINGVKFVGKVGALDKFSDIKIDLDADDPLRALSLRITGLGLGNNVPLKIIDEALVPVKDDLSMNKFKKLMRESGLCLANGELYGKGLGSKLKYGTLRVPKEKAKRYELVKRCLTHSH